jgi:3-hydroxymyristoyl/3-hydroxydecanoyl-(acyl carrier protein) dehydratase
MQMDSNSGEHPVMNPNGRARLEGVPLTKPGFPQILSITAESPHTRILLDVSSDLCWFRGHFPGQPVLPGIVQLHWAILVCRALCGFSEVPHEVKRLKFKKVVVPPSALELLVSQQGEREALFRFSSLGDVNSEGKILFSET